MTTKREAVLEALRTQIDAALGATINVTRNQPIPLEVPAGGWVNQTDGDPDRGDFIHGADQYEMDHVVPLEVIVQADTNAARNAAMDVLLAAIGAAIRTDRTLGGEVEEIFIGDPASGPVTEVGVEDWLGAEVPITLLYLSTDGLS